MQARSYALRDAAYGAGGSGRGAEGLRLRGCLGLMGAGGFTVGGATEGERGAAAAAEACELTSGPSITRDGSCRDVGRSLTPVHCAWACAEQRART